MTYRSRSTAAELTPSVPGRLEHGLGCRGATVVILLMFFDAGEEFVDELPSVRPTSVRFAF
jgi:hypothetical protein